MSGLFWVIDGNGKFGEVILGIFFLVEIYSAHFYG